jgi:hypothetical protein
LLAAVLLLASCWEVSTGGVCASGRSTAELLLVRGPCRVSPDLQMAVDGTTISSAVDGCSGVVVEGLEACEVVIRKLPWLDPVVIPMEARC